jgi:hypothetical protein
MFFFPYRPTRRKNGRGEKTVPNRSVMTVIEDGGLPSKTKQR